MVVTENGALVGFERHHQPLALPVFRHMGQAQPAHLPRIGPTRHRGPVHRDGARCRCMGAGDGGQQFRLPVARNPGNADDFAGAHRQADRLHAVDPAPVGDGQVVDLQHRLRRLGRFLVDAEQDLPADHQLGQLLLVGICRRHGAHDCALAHDGDVVSDGHDLPKLVGDQQHRFALVAHTALRDDPQLTVRYVDGPNPRRVVVSGRGRVLADGLELDLLNGRGCEVLVAEDHARPAPSEQVHVAALPSANGSLEPTDVLAHLRARDIHSIYLEGGAGTLSKFLAARCLDLLQVHVASLLLGSGIPSISLPEVAHVRDGVPLRMDHVSLDGHILMTCAVDSSAP